MRRLSQVSSCISQTTFGIDASSQFILKEGVGGEDGRGGRTADRWCNIRQHEDELVCLLDSVNPSSSSPVHTHHPQCLLWSHWIPVPR